MELRKHHTQMSPAEQSRLVNAVRAGKFSTTPYSWGRINQRSLPPNFITALQTYGKPIEAHKVGEDMRVLMRGKVAGKSSCAVFSLTKGIVITVWQNDITDHHRTLDTSIYNWKGEIIL